MGVSTDQILKSMDVGRGEEGWLRVFWVGGKEEGLAFLDLVVLPFSPGANTIRNTGRGKQSAAGTGIKKGTRVLYADRTSMPSHVVASEGEGGGKDLPGCCSTYLHILLRPPF